MRARLSRFVPALFALGVVAMAPSAVMAQAGPPADAQADALFHEVMSPFCPGLTLADCPSQQAFEMRGDIERRLAGGEPREAILDELVATYGAEILADPSDTPIGRIVWGVPMVLSVLAAAGLAVFLRRVTRGGPIDRTTESDITPAARGRLDEELTALD